MIKHCVLLKFSPDTSAETVNALFRELADLKGKIPGLLDFCGGPYSSPEGLNRGYTHAFLMTFQDAASRDAYLPHPDHLAAAGRIVPRVEGGVEGIVAFDFEA
jgi:hypothetical protein